MYYISKLKGKLIGIIDTSDMIEDFLSPKDVLLAERQGYKIEGIVRHNGNVYFIPITPTMLAIKSIPVGTPVRIKMTSGLDYKQTIYLGNKFDDSRKDVVFYFFDDSGVDGYFGISCKYALNNIKELMYDTNNDAVRVATLLKRIKDIGFSLI